MKIIQLQTVFSRLYAINLTFYKFVYMEKYLYNYFSNYYTFHLLLLTLFQLQNIKQFVFFEFFYISKTKIKKYSVNTVYCCSTTALQIKKCESIAYFHHFQIKKLSYDSSHHLTHVYCLFQYGSRGEFMLLKIKQVLRWRLIVVNQSAIFIFSQASSSL